MSRIHYQLHATESERPETWILVLHGILGSGSNWTTFAKRLVAARPKVGVVLPDLRAHGRSLDLSPPDDLESCAADLHRLEDELDVRFRCVAGHSFGSKVATVFARDAGALETLVLLDGSPARSSVASESPRRPDDVDRVLSALEELPAVWKTRGDFVDALSAKGLAVGVGQWLATNLRRDAGEAPLRFRLDLSAIRTLLDDYRRTETWGILERLASEGRRIATVVGERSPVVAAESRARLEALGPVEVLSGAGHWVHVDALEDLLEAFIGHLDANPPAPRPGQD